MSKILRLTAENVKRLKAVEIRPDGELVVVAGGNAQGKSSVLDSIMYALAGAGSLPGVPVRRGEEKAMVEVDLGDMVVRRTFTAAGGTSIKVTNKDGAVQTSPQAILDRLAGKLSFDPLEFSRRPADQGNTLRKLVGLDFTKIDQEKQAAYDARTMVGREVKSLEGRLAGIPYPEPGLPNEEQSVATILAEQTAAQRFNSENDAKRRESASAAGYVATLEKQAKDAKATVKQCEETLAKAQQNLASILGTITQAEKEAKELASVAEKLVDKPLTGYADQVKAVEATNAKVRSARVHSETSKQLKAKRGEHDALTKKIEACESEKRRMIREAKYPIEGLSVADTGDVLFNGLPFTQASAAEQLKVSVAIGLALNPTLRVILIRDGSPAPSYPHSLMR